MAARLGSPYASAQGGYWEPEFPFRILAFGDDCHAAVSH